MEWRIGIIWWVIFYIRYSRLWVHHQKTSKVTENSSIRIYVNKTENKITFKFKTGYYLQLLTRDTIKLLGSTKSKTTKNDNCRNMPYLEIHEIVLVYCNIVSNDYQQNYCKHYFSY